MGKVKRINAKGLNDIVTAIRNIKPGEEVAYGNQSGGLRLGLENGEAQLALKAAIQAESAGHAMRFHRRVGVSSYDYVVRGVTPLARERIEKAIANLPVNSRFTPAR